MHDLDLDIYESVSNINMPNEMPHTTFYLLTMAMFALSVTICEKFAIQMCMTLTFAFEMDQYKKGSKKRLHATFYLFSITMFTIFVSVCEILAVDPDI